MQYHGNVLLWPKSEESKKSLVLFYLFTLCLGGDHKALTYVEYRAVSGVFQNIDPSPTRRAVRGWGVTRHWIGLLQYNPSTGDAHKSGIGESVADAYTTQPNSKASSRVLYNIFESTCGG